MTRSLPDTRRQPGNEIAVHIEEMTGEGFPDGPHLLVAAGPILEALASAGVTMQAGSLIRLTGSTAVLEGLADGSLHLLKSGDGFLSSAANVDGRIVGQLRVAPAPTTAVRFAAGFQVASAITLQYHLHQITSSLHRLEGRLDVVIAGQLHEITGRLQAAAGTVEDVTAHTGQLSALDEERLHDALRDTENVAEQAALWLEGTLTLIAPLGRFVGESVERKPEAAGKGGFQGLVTYVAGSALSAAQAATNHMAATHFSGAVNDLDGQRDRVARTMQLILESVAVTALAYRQLQSRLAAESQPALAAERAARMGRLARRIHRVVPDLGPLTDDDAVRAVERRCPLIRGLGTRLQGLVDWLGELKRAAGEAFDLIERDAEQRLELSDAELRVLNVVTGPVAWFTWLGDDHQETTAAKVSLGLGPHTAAASC